MSADDRKLDTVSEGEFAGWVMEANREGFNGLVGPYYYLPDDPTNIKVAFKAEKHHLNAGGSVHGGCLLTLADTSLFIFAYPQLAGDGAVTVQLDSQFQSPGREGDILIATGEITRVGQTLIYGRGQISCGDRIVLSYSGILARKKSRPNGDGA